MISHALNCASESKKFFSSCQCCRANVLSKPSLGSKRVELGESEAARSLLQHVFVAVTSYWPTAQRYIERTLLAIAEYSLVVTVLEVVVIVDNDGSDNMNLLLFNRSIFDLFSNLRVVQANVSGFAIAHAYRRLFESALRRPPHTRPTAFVNLEEDMVVPVVALIDWAIDTVDLELVGLQRGFFRYEYGRFGCVWLADVPQPFRVSVAPVVRTFANMTFNPSWTPVGRNGALFVLGARSFAHLSSQYSAVTMATTMNLHKYVRSKYWGLSAYHEYGEREFASSGMNYFAPTVVPLDTVIKELIPSAGVWHSSNKGNFARICQSEAVE
jgi:hypothetical protein